MALFDDVLNNVGEPYKGGKGFEYGTHEVIIGTAEAKENKDRPTIEVVVFDEADNDKKATCTLWFHTDGAAKMAVTKVLGLLVHNVGEEKKDKVRELGRKLFGDITDKTKARDIAAKLMSEKLVGKKGYLVAEPQGDYKTTAYGNLWPYAAELKKKETVELADGTVGEVVDASELPDFEDGDI